ncbi:MAG: glutamyl-tRNA reductase [Ruminococcus sp.]|nr:glutamyl-tRNA reductase [Ruminococcus sp.]
MNCLSINYKNAGVDIRAAFALPPDKRRELSAALREKGCGESVVLCTCNRTELYFTGDDTDTAMQLLAAAADTDIREVSRYIRTYCGISASRHLFRVACGVDSMIIGEDEILGQVRNAYYEAAENGFTGYELNTAFQAAVACAKKIKTETGLSTTPVSAATLAANEAAHFAGQVSVLLIGATGKIGSSVLKNLLCHRNVTITQTIRSHSHDPLRIVHPDLKTIDYADRYSCVNEADCIISASSSPHFTITGNDLAAAVTDNKPRLLIDLAVPPDIDTAAGELDGVRLIGIDYFRQLAKENNLLRLSSAEQAEQIISGELDELEKKLVFHDFLPFMERSGEAAARLRFDELIYRMKSELCSDQLKAVLDFYRNLEI